LCAGALAAFTFCNALGAASTLPPPDTTVRPLPRPAGDAARGAVTSRSAVPPLTPRRPLRAQPDAEVLAGFAAASASSASAGAPVVAGRTPTSFDVSSSGAALYTIPLWMPPGIGALQLDLALQYSSRAPNGLLGQGWALTGLSAITRCNRTWEQDGTPGAVTYTYADRFCLDGQQLKLVSGSPGQPGSVAVRAT
jgi:hypothetical protein